jgi:accessory gene regulator protein AgrB
MAVFVIVAIGLYFLAPGRSRRIPLFSPRLVSAKEMQTRWIIMILLIVILVGAVNSLFH